jgi:hypothetical protein
MLLLVWFWLLLGFRLGFRLVLVWFGFDLARACLMFASN